MGPSDMKPMWQSVHMFILLNSQLETSYLRLSQILL